MDASSGCMGDTSVKIAQRQNVKQLGATRQNSVNQANHGSGLSSMHRDTADETAVNEQFVDQETMKERIALTFRVGSSLFKIERDHDILG